MGRTPLVLQVAARAVARWVKVATSVVGDAKEEGPEEEATGSATPDSVVLAARGRIRTLCTCSDRSGPRRCHYTR